MSKFPQPWRSSVSYWQATNRGPGSLYGHGKDDALPSDADIVIVGGGMMGCALSYFLTREGAYGAGKRVVCVEAKDLASGASGRNGGHVGPKTSALWAQLQQPYPVGLCLSPEESARVMQNERDNLDIVTDVVKREGLNVDFWRGELLETHHGEEVTAKAKKDYAAWLAQRKSMGLSGDNTCFVDDPVEATKLSRVRDTTSLQVRPGGSVHSHKLATELMRKALESKHSDFSFHSWTPVDGFPRKSNKGWTLSTSKGEITAPRVILCTNAHTPNFFPKDNLIHDHIEPVLAQCSAITPTAAYSGASGLKNTYNTRNGHYLVTTASGQMVLGGGLAPLAKDGRSSLLNVYGNYDDSGRSVDPEITKDNARFMRENFVGWGKEAYGEGLSRTWVGLLTHVKDWLPLVGDVPGSPGVSLAAGFAGHGMSRIFAVARGYADTLNTGKWDERLLPKSFELTTKRLERVAADHAAYVSKHGDNFRMVEGHIVDGDKVPRLAAKL